MVGLLALFNKTKQKTKKEEEEELKNKNESSWLDVSKRDEKENELKKEKNNKKGF